MSAKNEIQIKAVEKTNSLLVFDPLGNGYAIKKNLMAGLATWKQQLKRGINYHSSILFVFFCSVLFCSILFCSILFCSVSLHIQI
jgi:hypothetical protein